MKIGFDVSQTGQGKAGCGFFAENMIRHLAAIDTVNSYLLLPTFGDHYWDPKSSNTCQIAQPNFKQGFKHTHPLDAKKFWRGKPEVLQKKLGDIDILHSNNFYCPPQLPHTRQVYTLYDLSFIEYPECTTEHNRIACFEGVFNASVNADLILSISHASRKHFLEIFPHVPSERVVVCQPASRFSAHSKTTAQTHKLHALKSQQFWLNVGTLEPRKNIKHLLQTYARLRAAQPNTFPLVLAGKLGWMEENLDQLLETLKLKNHVYLLGYVDNNELQWLFQNCYAFVYPSLFEGFGLPLLEAMTFGAAVVTSNISAIPEVVGDAGLLINPRDPDELLQAMIKISTDPKGRETLKNAAIKQATLFSWRNTAKIMLGYYREVMNMPRRHSSIISPVVHEPLTSNALL